MMSEACLSFRQALSVAPEWPFDAGIEAAAHSARHRSMTDNMMVLTLIVAPKVIIVSTSKPHHDEIFITISFGLFGLRRFWRICSSNV